MSRTLLLGTTVLLLISAVAEAEDEARAGESHYIFVTSVAYDGDLGGLTGADSLCASHAASGALTSGLGLTWRALLSVNGVVDARDRIGWVGPVYDVLGNLVTSDPTAWPWEKNNLSDFMANEDGVACLDSSVWTGSDVNGVSVGPSNDCRGWTDSSGESDGWAGEVGEVNSNEWFDSYGNPCDDSRFALYCVSKSDAVIFADGFESGDTSAWDSCPTASHQCAEIPPIDWNGPATVHLGDAGLPPQVCSGDYPDPGTTLFTDLDVPVATCECGCGEPAGATCLGTGTLEYHADTFSCATVSPPSWSVGDCTTLGFSYPGGEYWSFSASAMIVTAGSCAPEATASIPGASFDSRLSPCGGATALAGCQGGFTCLPNPAEPFDNALCIWRSGDVPCPTGSTYSQRTVYHTDFDDYRDCGVCACGNPVGDCIDSSVYLTDSPDCGVGTFLGTVPGDGTCIRGLSGSSVQAGIFNEVVNATCAPTGGELLGSVVSIGPFTVCCTTP